MKMLVALAVLAVSVLTMGTAYAQFETATVLGTVRDASNAVVPDASVTLTNTATGVSATKTTNAEGNYEFFNVSAGIYLLTVEKSGFAMAIIENTTVPVGSRLRVDAQMSVGQVSERVLKEIQTDTPAASYGVLVRLAHDVLAADPDQGWADRCEALKIRARQLDIAIDSDVIGRALFSAEYQRNPPTVGTPKRRRQKGNHS